MTILNRLYSRIKKKSPSTEGLTLCLRFAAGLYDISTPSLRSSGPAIKKKSPLSGAIQLVSIFV